MDNSNNNIRFVGYCADGTLRQALKHRKYAMNLKDFYNAVNQASSGCSCCKQDDVKVYCMQPVGLLIKQTVLSLCVNCISNKLPIELTIINIDSNGAPPLLISRVC
jgi:hypothetical protein